MQAKIKSDARYPSLNFFSGVEFTKGEWRQVPAGFEDAATANDYLETREDPAPLEAVEATPEVKTEATHEIKTDFEVTTAPQKLPTATKAKRTNAKNTNSAKRGKAGK